MKKRGNERMTGLLYAFSGIFLMSFDTLLIRLADVSGWDAAFYRGFFIFLMTGFIFITKNKTGSVRIIVSGRIPLLVSGILWGLGGLFFVLSIKLTIAANTLVLLSLSPVFAALFSYLLMKELIAKKTWAAITVAVAGVSVIFSGDIGSGNTAGNIIGLLVPICIAFNLTLMRKYPDINRTAAVVIGGLVTSGISVISASPSSVPGLSVFYLALLGLLFIPFSQLLIANGTRYIPSPEVGLVMMSETFLGPLWVWIVLGELPAKNTFIGGALILSAIAVNTLPSLKYASAGSDKDQ